MDTGHVALSSSLTLRAMLCYVWLNWRPACQSFVFCYTVQCCPAWQLVWCVIVAGFGCQLDFNKDLLLLLLSHQICDVADFHFITVTLVYSLTLCFVWRWSSITAQFLNGQCPLCGSWFTADQMRCCVPNVIKIGRLCVEIRQFYDLQYGRSLPSWIFEI